MNDNITICNECGLPFDMSDLGQVFTHEHKGLTIKKEIKSKRIIKHARDIYPNATTQFCMGVHNYLSGKYDESKMYQETEEFRKRFYQAQYELEDNYKLEN